MPIFMTLAFLSGDLFLQQFSSLPSMRMVLLCLITSLIAGKFLCRLARQPVKKYLYLGLFFLLGFAYADWYARSFLKINLPESMEAKPVLATGYVASLPGLEKGISHFFLKTAYLKQGERVFPFHALIRLSWRNEVIKIIPGDRWQFYVRLKRIHGTQNPGAFDFEAWALQQGVRASGYVLSSAYNRRLSHSPYRYGVDQMRYRLQERMAAYLPVSPTAPWLNALVMGEKKGIAQKDWEVLRSTGTNHLMAIGGLHIGLIAGWSRIVAAWLWRRIPALLLMYPAQQVGAVAALVTAVLYSLLAGFSLPTQRACLMLLVFISMYLLKRKIPAWTSWSCAMMVVLIWNPLSILTESFWLSFATIALIIYGMSARLRVQHFWWKWGRVQWVIGLGLLPLTAVLFQQCSLVSFVANSIAIPWLGFFILPFCFLSGIFLWFLPALGGWLLYVADQSLSLLWIILSALAHCSFSSWHPASLSLWAAVAAIGGFLFMLSPLGFPGKWRGLLWLMPFVFVKPSVPVSGDFWVTLLDVGQGLAVVVRTEKHVMVYDAGAKWNENFDMGESVVVPYLYQVGTKHLDTLMISHGDNDHIGGAQALLHAFPTQDIQSSVPERLAPHAVTCLAGSQWEWDKVKFSILYPGPEDLGLDNDSSCVLRIENAAHAVLLTGDIEKYAEKKLLSTSKEKLAADILIAPHHGSKTSNLMDFVRAVHPQFVLYSTGYLNRYHHPHPQVLSVYQTTHSVQLNTVQTGAMLFYIPHQAAIHAPLLYRVEHRRYWYG